MRYLRRYVRNILLEGPEEPDITRYVDELEDEIFRFLFKRSVFDQLQTQDVGQIVLDTTLFDDYDNINLVHLEVQVNDIGVADTDAAYMCIPEDRASSNLVISLNIPRNYPHVDGFQDWLSAELADVLSHEIQHSCDPTEMLSGDCPEGEEKWISLENIEKYYTCDAEIRGHVAGILGRARRTGSDPLELLDVDMETIERKALARNYTKSEIRPVIQNIYNQWLSHLGAVP